MLKDGQATFPIPVSFKSHVHEVAVYVEWMEKRFSLTRIKIVLPDKVCVLDQPQGCVGLFPCVVRCTFSFVGLGSVLTSIASGAKADDSQS